MLIADVIYESLFKAQLYSTYFFSQICDKKKYGEDITCDQNKFIVLGEWIRILQDYYDNLEDGLPPEEACLSYEQICELMSKLKVMIGNVKLEPVDGYQFQTLLWQDGAIWRDDLRWNDSLQIT